MCVHPRGGLDKCSDESGHTPDLARLRDGERLVQTLLRRTPNTAMLFFFL